MRTRLTVLACLPVLALSAGLLAPVATGAGRAHHKPPRIRSGRYVEVGVDAYLDVNVKARTASFHFTLYCNDLYADQWVSSGPEPEKAELKGNRRGARVFGSGYYEGLPAVGPGTSQVADWVLNGKFTRPTHFEGRVEYEAATFPEPVSSRPQCLDARRLHLDLRPPSPTPEARR